MRRSLQVKVGIGMGRRRQSATSRLQSKIEFCGSQFHVIAPFTFRIEAVGNHCEEIAARRGVCEIKDMFCGKQTTVGINLRAGVSVVSMEAECKSGSHPA